MKDALSGAGTIIDYQTISLGIEVFLGGDGFCHEKKMPDKFFIGHNHAVNIGNVFTGDNKAMKWRLGIHVFKRNGTLILIKDFRRYFFVDNFAKNAVHRSTPAKPTVRS